MARTKFLLLGLIVLLGSLAVLGHVVAADLIMPTLTASGPIEVVAGASGHNLLTFGGIGTLVGGITDVLITCTGLPTGASFSLSPYPNPLPGPVSDGNSFTLTVTTSLATPPNTYPITCEVASFTEPEIIAPSFAIPPVSLSNGAGSLGPDSISIQQPPPTFNLIVDPITQPLTTNVAAGSGSVSPNCPSGCSEAVGSSISVTATPSANWQFSSWSTQTGIACSSNPCTFTMPNNAVTLKATFTPVPPIPEYPLGLPILAILMIIGYGLVRRRTRN